MTRTSLRRTAAYTVACVAAIIALTACGGSPNTTTPEPSPTLVSASASTATSVATPGPTATAQTATPSQAASQNPKGPVSTYKPNGKPLVIKGRIGNLPGFVQDGDQWWCGGSDEQVDNVGNLEITEFGKTFGISDSDFSVGTKQTDSSLRIQLSPYNRYYGGIVTRSNDSQVPFILPLIAGETSKYAPYFELPKEDFGTATSVELCSDSL